MKKETSIGIDTPSGGKVALLLIDIQNDYFENGTNALHNPLDALNNGEKILQYFRDENLEIIHVQHLNNPGSTLFVEGSWGAEIHEDLTPLDNETIITKKQISSFAGTNLEDVLREKDISYLIISGMQSNVCVEGTTKSAHAIGFNITVLEDACAAKDQATHERAMKLLSDEYATVISTEEFLRGNG